MHHPPEPKPEMPGAFEDQLQHSQLLHEMDTAPRCSGHARVPNPRYYNANNAALPSRQHNAVNVLDVAAAPAASAPLAALGTSIASQATPIQATNIVPIARTAAASLAALAVHTTPTDEVRQLVLADLLAAAALAAADAEKWAVACQYEMDALSKNDTWELVNLPPGCKAIKSKWVFKLKADGHFCACLVAKGFMQVPGIDYDETFFPVACFESL
jgi:reverse transcriptase-like protein